MRVCHVSDTHGGFPKLFGRFDVVVHSGDFFPNSVHSNEGNKTREMTFQLDWLTQKLPVMKEWLQGRTFLYVLGNHDFLHPGLMESTLRAEGIKAIDLTDKLVNYQEINFYGFPYVPFINGSFNYEREIPEMEQEVNEMIAVLNETYTDVLVCHAPLYKCLDLAHGNRHFGSSVIATAIDYKLQKEMVPANYLHGHIHEAHGITMRNGMLVSNAAVTHHIIEIL